MIGSALNKTCQLDPVPTWLVKNVSSVVALHRASSRIYVTEYFKSFITVVSYTVHVTCSVPQGSVLGPRLFIMYTPADLEGWWARRQLSRFCWRYAVEWVLLLRWYADCCWETWTLCHRYQSLDVGTPPQAKYRKDSAAWNSLPDSLRDPELNLDTFKRQLKTYIFCEIMLCWLSRRDS